MYPTWFKYTECPVSSLSEIDSEYRLGSDMGNCDGDFNHSWYYRFCNDIHQKESNKGFFIKPRIKFGKIRARRPNDNNNQP